MSTLIKTSMKQLMRTKTFWFFVLLAPLLSVLILRSQINFTTVQDAETEIVELENADEKVAYYSGKGEYVIKVYDASATELSGYLLEDLQQSGLFTVCRAYVSGEEMQETFIADRIREDGFEDKLGAAICIPADFDEKIREGKTEEAMRIYILSDDSRSEALESEVKLQFSRMERFGDLMAVIGGTEENFSTDLLQALKDVDEQVPEKHEISVTGGGGRSLSYEQNNQKSRMGYAFVFLTLGFVFGGFFVAYTSIKEQKNGVFTRIMLTNTSSPEYFASKIACAFLVSLMMTGITAVCSLLLKPEEMGMNRGRFIAVIFMLGLIFSGLSTLLAIIMGDVMSGAMAVFTVWCISSLLSGMYFPITHMSEALKMLSMMMPQKWFMEGTEMIFVGDNAAFRVLLYTTVAYLVIILGLGSLGLKMKRADAWELG